MTSVNLLRAWPARDAYAAERYDRLREDVEYLLAAGEPVRAVAAAVGRTESALARRFYRWGHRDLARQFEQEVRAAERQRSHHRVREVAA